MNVALTRGTTNAKATAPSASTLGSTRMGRRREEDCANSSSSAITLLLFLPRLGQHREGPAEREVVM